MAAKNKCPTFSSAFQLNVFTQVVVCVGFHEGQLLLLNKALCFDAAGGRFGVKEQATLPRNPMSLKESSHLLF